MAVTVQLTIGQLAKQASVNVETIRYYQRLGLMPTPDKPVNGFRVYSALFVDRISFIKNAQKLGFSLSEINDLLRLSDGGFDDVKKLAQKKRDDVQKQIDGLIAIQKGLDKLINSCQEEDDQQSCRFIEALTLNWQEL